MDKKTYIVTEPGGVWIFGNFHEEGAEVALNDRQAEYQGGVRLKSDAAPAPRKGKAAPAEG